MTTGRRYAWIAIGAMLGSTVRFLVGETIDFSRLPVETLLVNIIGSLILGVIIGHDAFGPEFHHRWVDGLGTGFCGGLTTVSTFAVEAAVFVRADDWALAVAYLLLSISTGLIAAAIGWYLGRFHLRPSQ